MKRREDTTAARLSWVDAACGTSAADRLWTRWRRITPHNSTLQSPIHSFSNVSKVCWNVHQLFFKTVTCSSYLSAQRVAGVDSNKGDCSRMTSFYLKSHPKTSVEIHSHLNNIPSAKGRLWQIACFRQPYRVHLTAHDDVTQSKADRMCS
eukprot:4570840-Amphidinium_carterae.1